MEAHSGDKTIRVLYSSYRSILHAITSEATWMRGMGVDVEHESECLESTARSLEQTFARMMKLRVPGAGR